MKKLLLLMFVALAFFSTSCVKDDSGNANMSTVEFDVQESEWIEFGNYGFAGYGWAVDLSFPEITDNVIQNGMVTLYRKTGDTWTPVPVYYYNDGYEGGYLYFMKRGMFSIEYYESDHLTVNPGTQIFRLVIVQPK